jgi:two-component system, NarL family, sensor histidine kinase ComP
MYKKRSIIIFIFFIVSHIYLISITLNPYIGITVQEDNKGNLYIQQIHQNDGWARNTELLQGDILLEINGNKLDSNKNYSMEYGKEIKVLRNKGIQIFKLEENQILYTTSELLIPIIFSTLTFFLSIIIFKKGNSIAYYLSGFLLTTATSFFASSEAGHGQLLANALISISMSIGVLFLIKFIYALFLEKKIIQTEAQRLIQINSLICFTIIFADLLNLKFQYISILLMGNILLLYFCINLICIILFLTYVYIVHRNSKHKTFLKWLIFINIFAFLPFIILHAVPFMFDGPYLKDDLAGFFLFIIPLGYFYLVMSNQLLDINFITNQISYYILLSLGPAILITFVIINGTLYIDNVFFHFIFILIFILFVNICLFFLKEKIEFIFRNHLLSNQKRLEKYLEEFTHKLTACMKKEDLKNLLISQIQSTLEVNSIVLVKFNTKSLEYELENSHQENHYFTLTNQVKDIIQKDSNGDLLEYKEYLGIQIYQTECTKTYIWIGYKNNQTAFTIQEKIWIINIVKYQRLVYENLVAVENMIESIENPSSKYDSSSLTLSRFLFQLSENERRRLATDLHDSALQDQILWYRKLDHYLKENKHLPDANQEQLIKIKNGMKDVINQIRYTCNELRPNLLFEFGLIQSLNTLCTQMQLKANYTLNYEFSNFTSNIADYNLKICIYRVLQELLNNANKHSEASQVYLCMWEDINTIYLDYRDNGIGFNISNECSNPQQMGIAGLKERIMSVNGQIDISSKIGHGLKVYITLPVR